MHTRPHTRPHMQPHTCNRTHAKNKSSITLIFFHSSSAQDTPFVDFQIVCVGTGTVTVAGTGTVTVTGAVTTSTVGSACTTPAIAPASPSSLAESSSLIRLIRASACTSACTCASTVANPRPRRFCLPRLLSPMVTPPWSPRESRPWRRHHW